MTEFELIYKYFKQHSNQESSSKPHIIKGLGDDAAVVDFKADSQWVTCVDTLVQGRHFNDDWGQVNELAFTIGYKAVAVNISDIAAMGARPHSIMLALALPEQLANETWLSAFAKGLFHACTQFGVCLIGGDTTRHDKLIISITANGVMNEETAPIYRNGAKVGDRVYVSGTLGDACYALYHPTTEVGQRLAHRLHMPTPRISLGQVMAQLQSVGAMIDISDGLIQDLAHICQQSNVAMRIDLEQLPSSEPLKKVTLEERLRCQLTGGDDYELAFTLPSHISVPETSTKVTCIGEVVKHTDKTLTTVTLRYQGNDVTKQNPYPFITLPSLKGFQHFN